MRFLQKTICLVLISFFTLSSGLIYNNIVAYAQQNYNIDSTKDYKITVVGDKKTYTFFGQDFYQVLGDLQLNDFDDKINQIIQAENILPKNSEIFFHPNCDKKFTITKERQGKLVDKESLTTDMLFALQSFGGKFNLKYNVASPIITKDMLQNYTYKLSTFTTYFSDNLERVNNITLATNSINGCVLADKETFSFNKVVGERTEARGYKKAKIIQDNGFLDGIGGGVCQVSTTLYNSMLLAGLNVTECHPHTLAVGYVDRSFDAMVSGGYADFKFTNNSGGMVFIEGKTTKNSVTFTIYGTKTDKVFKLKSVTTDVFEPNIIIKDSPTLLKGDSQFVLGKRGYKSQGYLLVTENGTITQKLLRNDYYKKVDSINYIGIG